MTMPVTAFIQNDNSVSTLLCATTALTSVFASVPTVINIQGANRISFHCTFTLGNASGLAIRMKESRDVSANWKHELEQEQTGTGSTLYRPNDRYALITTTSQTPFKMTKTLDNTDRFAKVWIKGFTHCTNAKVRIIAITSYA